MYNCILSVAIGTYIFLLIVLLIQNDVYFTGGYFVTLVYF